MSLRAAYGAAIFLGALLLFGVEPMAAKELLPRMGGSSAVWLASLCFFQVMLLGGYAYAYGLTWDLTRDLASRRARVLHAGFLLLTVLVLLGQRRSLAGGAWTGNHPFAVVFGTLLGRVGLPFWLLAASSPLLQVMMARQWGRVPYRMFALSNAGSLLGLVLYPLLVEPRLTLPEQRGWWTAGFAVYAVLCGLLFWIGAKTSTSAKGNGEGTVERTRTGTGEREPSIAVVEDEIGRRRAWMCVALAAVGALQLVAVTEHLTENVAALPLLWVLPLIVYLLSFMTAFELPGIYQRGLVVRLLVVMLASLGYLLSKTDVSLPIGLAIMFFLFELFIACWFCHAELYRLRPMGARAAARFYLLLAAGGAAGTAIAAVGFPLLLRANYDLALAFAATAAVALWVTWQDGVAQRVLWTVSTAGCLLLTGALVNGYRRDSLVMLRNFYGPLRVKQTLLPPQAGTSRVLLHGQIQHGMQWFAPEFRTEPLSYYARDSGVGLAMTLCCGAVTQGNADATVTPERRPAGRRIGVIGLGAGTMAAYGRPGDVMRFYEINPAVERLARELFTYTRESRARIEVVTGDARLSLGREPAAREYDMLVVDAFSGDAIPVHLLTRQAMAEFRGHLRPGGVLAFHVSNQYLDLAPVVGAVAQAEGMVARAVESPKVDTRGEFAATWVLVAVPGGLLEEGTPLWESSMAIPARAGVRAWTDDDSSLLPIMRWSGH